MAVEIFEKDVVPGKWYDFNEVNLPHERYYETGKEPMYKYLFMLEEPCDPDNKIYYWLEDDLPCSVDTFRRNVGWTYWMAIPKKYNRYDTDREH